MKEEFIEFLEKLMAAAPEVANTMSDNVKAYIDNIKEDRVQKAEMTENGKKILGYAQEFDRPMFKSKDLADAYGVSSRSVSGALRKLTADGYFEKMGKDPVVYALTEKGKNYKID